MCSELTYTIVDITSSSSQSVSFNLWALTSARHFSLHSLPLTGSSLIIGTTLCQPYKLLRSAEKPCRQHQKTQLPSLESLQSPFSPVLMLSMSFKQSSSPHLPAQMHQVAAAVCDLKCYIHGLLSCDEIYIFFFKSVCLCKYAVATLESIYKA